jgi:hypothetical protein
MKYYLKTPKNDAFIDLEATEKIEATLAAIKISSNETQRGLGYPCFTYGITAPSEFVASEAYLMKAHDEDRFNIENKVVSKWV